MPSSAFACLYFTFFLAALGRHCCRWTSSSCSEWGLLLITAHRLLTGVASLGAEHRLQARGPQQLQHTGLLAPWHVGSSWPRDQTRVPCTGRWILNHWTTREVPTGQILMKDLFLACRQLSSYCVLTWQRANSGIFVFPCGHQSQPPPRPTPLGFMTSSLYNCTHSQIASHWGLGLQHMDFRGTQTFSPTHLVSIMAEQSS